MYKTSGGYNTTMGSSRDTYEVIRNSDKQQVFEYVGEVYQAQYTTLPAITNSNDYYIFQFYLKY